MHCICTKYKSVSWANKRAIVVLPTPGGPQKTRLDGFYLEKYCCLMPEQHGLAQQLLQS